MISDLISRPLPQLAIALMIALIGGGAFWILGFPAPWLSGPAIATAAAALAGIPMQIPRWLRRPVLIFLGIMAGSAVTPETIAMLGRWPISLLGLAACITLIMLSISAYLERVHGFDRATARLSAVPGALQYVLALASESSADVRRVAIIQMVRLCALLVLLPTFLTLTGFEESRPMIQPATADPVLLDLLILGVAGVAGGLLFEWLRLPAGSLFGGLVAAAIVTGSGSVSNVVPAWLVVPAYLVVGTMVGANFAGTDRKLVVATLGASIGSFCVGVLAAMLCSLPVAWALGMPVAQVWLAYAPGGVETMAVMALALGLDVAFVGGHHAARFIGLGLVVPLWLRSFLDRSRNKSAG